MSKRLLGALGLACGLTLVGFVTESRVQASTPSCYVSNYTYAYNYGDPPEFLASRFNSDYWVGNMSENHCAGALSQNAVKQWGNEMCNQYSAGYVVLDWHYVYYDSNNVAHVDYFYQPFDCGDLP